MNKKEKLVAKVPADLKGDGICWLVIQFDTSSGGWFLFGHRALTDASEFDSWHSTREEAMKQAELQWHVGSSGWHTVFT